MGQTSSPISQLPHNFALCALTKQNSQLTRQTMKLLGSNFCCLHNAHVCLPPASGLFLVLLLLPLPLLPPPFLAPHPARTQKEEGRGRGRVAIKSEAQRPTNQVLKAGRRRCGGGRSKTDSTMGGSMGRACPPPPSSSSDEG